MQRAGAPMKATAIEFRLRFLIYGILYALGFFAPWNLVFHFDAIRTWQLLAATLARHGWLSFSTATVAVLGLGIFLAVVAAVVRTWGAAYRGAGVRGEQVVAAGPYRYMRQPLYAGTFLHTLVLGLLMPPSGAVFCVAAIGLFQLRLIGAEEAYLTRQLGESYVPYRSKVPRLVPAFTPRVAAAAVRPQWLSAFIGEVYYWGAAASFAIAGWRYNAQLVLQGVIISLGVSLVARGLLRKR
jgi:protein-S-isoprenylcysteine O-methyltransferase Ste14